MSSYNHQDNNNLESRLAAAKKELDDCRKMLAQFKEKSQPEHGRLPKPSDKNLAESLIKSQPGLFALIDHKGVLHWWNERLEYYTGLTPEELKKSTFPDFVIEEDRKAVEHKISEAYDRREADIEISLKSKEKGSIPFLLTCVRVNLDGKEYLICTGLDITEKEKEKNRKLSYFRVLENSSNGIFLFEAESFKLVYVNKGARKNLGYQEDELKEMYATDLLAGYNEETYNDYVKPLISDEVEKLVRITDFIRSNGSIYKTELHLHLIEQDNEKFLVGIAIDIADRLDHEEKIKASLKEKEILLGEVHHRVKNNLAIVSSLINMQVQNVGDEYVKTQLLESENRIKSMAMIHQMLYEEDDFTKISFNLYAKKMLDRIAINYHDQNTDIHTEVIGDDMYIQVGEAVPCALIINELITNAYKHPFKDRNKGKIQIILKIEDNMKKIVVKDDGIGMPPDFDLFQATTMGMSLIRGLTKQIGGTLELHQNGGTAFTVKFPTE